MISVHHVNISMLSNSLTTNEVKDKAGTEVEFGRISQLDRSTVFAKVGELPYLPHRLSISHQESGAGVKKVRRSVVRVDKTTLSGVDSTIPITTSAYLVLNHPVGYSSTADEAKNVIAEVISFVASLGASTTILYDCTGNGAVALVDGSL